MVTATTSEPNSPYQISCLASAAGAATHMQINFPQVHFFLATCSHIAHVKMADILYQTLSSENLWQLYFELISARLLNSFILLSSVHRKRCWENNFDPQLCTPCLLHTFLQAAFVWHFSNDTSFNCWTLVWKCGKKTTGRALLDQTICPSSPASCFQPGKPTSKSWRQELTLPVSNNIFLAFKAVSHNLLREF